MSVLDHRFPEDQPIEAFEFSSTRNPELKADAWEALIAGQAKDGGLFVPDLKDIKPFGSEFFAEGSDAYDLSMSQTSALLLRQFIPSEGEAGVSNLELQAMMDIAHDFDLPLNEIDEDTMVAWLSESRTASFKDFAARAIAQLMERYCEKNNTPKNIVVATSGDTGVAIADAFGGSKWVTVTVLYPNGGVSSVQEAQMIDAAEQYDNVKCLPIEGDFDKAQAYSKSMQFMRDLDPEEKSSVAALATKMTEQLNVTLADDVITDLSTQLQKLDLASANSINIWRLLPQMTQYFVSYAQAVKSGKIKPGEEIVFAVPTGNVGHLMAGLYAQKLGLPVKKFVVGTNSNDIMTCAIRDFELNHNSLKRNGKDENEALATESPSMDIADPSNLERFLPHIRDLCDPTAVLDLEKLKKDTKALVPGEKGKSLFEYGATQKMRAYMQTYFYADSITDKETTSLIHSVETFSKNRTVLEPHGTAAYKASQQAFADDFITRGKDKVIVFETAHIDKFPEALKRAGVEVVKSHAVLKDLDTTNPENPETVVTSVNDVVVKVNQAAADSFARRKAA